MKTVTLMMKIVSCTGIWRWHIFTPYHHHMFPPGGNLLGNQRIIMNTSIHVDEGIQFSEHRKADNSEEKLQIKKFQQFLETIQREKWTRCFYLGWAMGLGGYQQLWPTSATHVFTFPSHPFPSYFDVFCIYLDSDRGDYFPDCIIWNSSTGHCVEVVLYSDCKDVTNLIWDSKVKYSISPQKAYLVISLGSAISSSLTVSRKLEVNQPKCWRSASTNNVFQTYVFRQIDMVHTR